MTLIPYFWNLVLLDCYRNKMDAKDKEFYDIVFNNCTEEEIYAILLKKKEKVGPSFMGPLHCGLWILRSRANTLLSLYILYSGIRV